ncbi:hypothetical protein Q8A67_006011 [Cirrhinus molitorella]|uniref:Uncharacterized protein n=1 Tax=Cirrhinus molitorella TaxID=172907 RepID=A0AA88Q1C6_9TELE|nr:hypothetical protein Q8A67_006011 [Cirrhinus molitorella]
MSTYFRQGATTVAPMADNCSPQETPMPRLFALGLSVPASSSWKRQEQKEQSQACLFQKRREYKPQASLRQREVNAPELVKPPVPEASSQECSSEEAPVLECCSQGTPAETPQEEPVSELFPAEALIPEGSPQGASSLHRIPKASSFPHGAPMLKLFTLGISIPILSTKKYRLHKYEASLTHRICLPVITAEKSPVPESSSQGVAMPECSTQEESMAMGTPQSLSLLAAHLDEVMVEAIEPCRSSSNKAGMSQGVSQPAKAPKEVLMPDCSPQEAPMLECSSEDKPMLLPASDSRGTASLAVPVRGTPR